MAQANPNADVRAANGLVGTTHVLSVDDVSTVSVKAACLEAQNEFFTVVAVEDVVGFLCRLLLLLLCIYILLLGVFIYVYTYYY